MHSERVISQASDELPMQRIDSCDIPPRIPIPIVVWLELLVREWTTAELAPESVSLPAPLSPL